MFSAPLTERPAMSAEITLAAWLHIGPDDSSADPDSEPVGIQRLHVTDTECESYKNTDFGHALVMVDIQTKIASPVFALTEDDALYETAMEVTRDAIRQGCNIRLSLGGGMFATVFPAEPTSGVNLYRSAPLDYAADFDSADSH
jgi:hypothetical protein